MAYFLGSGFMTTVTATVAWSLKFWLPAAAAQPPQSTISHAVGQRWDRNVMCSSYGMNNTFTFLSRVSSPTKTWGQVRNSIYSYEFPAMNAVEWAILDSYTHRYSKVNIRETIVSKDWPRVTMIPLSRMLNIPPQRSEERTSSFKEETVRTTAFASSAALQPDLCQGEIHRKHCLELTLYYLPGAPFWRLQ